jgi:hypothetical protein
MSKILFNKKIAMRYLYKSVAKEQEFLINLYE